MGELISFPRVRPPAPAPAEPQLIAEILFFTGVRYQRLIEAAPSDAGGARPSSAGGLGPKRKRKRG